MDDLTEKLNDILNDPESMEQIQKIAENLFSSEEGEKNGGDMPNSEQMQKILSLLSRFNAAGNDDRAKLIEALRPYLGKKRREKADNALKLLKVIEILPFLKESGLFNM